VTGLHLRAEHTEQIHAHLCRAYPEEGCGVLLGREAGGTRVIERVLPFENRREDERHHRFLIAPEQFLVAEREGREAGLDVVGFFHSHPDHPALPSGFDLEHAWPYYSYLIVSVEQGRAGDSRSWRLAADRSRFEPEKIELMPAEAPAGGHAGPET
jgi:proteasome lid subunit RPN8/RPN11